MNDICTGNSKSGGGCGGSGFIAIVILSGNQSSTKIDTVRDLCNVLSSLGVTQCILVLKVALTDKSRKTIESEYGSKVKIHYWLRSSVQYDWYNNMTQPLMAKVAKNEDVIDVGETDRQPSHTAVSSASWLLEGIHSPSNHQRYWDRPHVMKPTPRQSLSTMIGAASTQQALSNAHGKDDDGNIWYSCAESTGYQHCVSPEMVIVSSLMKHIVQTLFIQGAICISECDENIERIVPCNHVDCQRDGHDRSYRKFILDDEESCAAMTREKQSSIFSSLQSLKNVNAIFAGYVRRRSIETLSTLALESATTSLSLYQQVLGHLQPSVDYLPGIISGPITTRFSLKTGDLLHSQRHTPRIHRMLRHFNKTGRGGRSNTAAASANDNDDDE